MKLSSGFKIVLCSISIPFAFYVGTINASEIDTEEIIVTNKSFGDMRSDLIKAENKMYSLFNSLIDDEDFKIVCRKVRINGGYISRRVCEPAFIIEARVRDYQLGRQISGPMGANEFVRSDRELNRNFSDKRQEMENLVVDLAMKNPELYDAILEARALGEELKLARELRFGD